MRTRSILFAALFFLCTVANADEGQLFNHVGTVRGEVIIENHPELGRTPCRNCAFLLQFSRCKDALVYVQTDSEGLYKIRIGLGRWKVIMRDIPQESSQEESPDMLSAKQSRYLVVKSVLGEERFDITVHLPHPKSR